MIPADPAAATEILALAKTFGLGVSVLFFWLWHEIRQRQAVQELLTQVRDGAAARDVQHSKDLLDLSKENIATITSFADLIQSVAPAIASSGAEVRKDVEQSVIRVKDHVSHHCQLLEAAIRASQKPA